MYGSRLGRPNDSFIDIPEVVPSHDVLRSETLLSDEMIGELDVNGAVANRLCELDVKLLLCEL